MISSSSPNLPPALFNSGDASNTNQDAQPATVEFAKIYVGLNDAVTREQKLATERDANILKNVCRDFKTPFSFNIMEGGYLHDDGEYVVETSIMLTLIDVPTETVDAIAKELCILFNQESVLITTETAHVRSVHDSL